MQLRALAILTLELCGHIILNHRLICEFHEYSGLRKPFSRCFVSYLDWGKECELTLNVSLICGHFTVSGERKYFQYSKTIFRFSEDKILIVGFIASLFVLLININKNICQQCSLISWSQSLSTDARVWQGKKEPKHSPKVDQLHGIYNTEHQILWDRNLCAAHSLSIGEMNTYIHVYCCSTYQCLSIYQNKNIIVFISAYYTLYT